MKRGRLKLKWKRKDDRRIMEMVGGREGREEIDWEEIANEVEGKTAVQVKQRYNQYLREKIRRRREKRYEIQVRIEIGDEREK